MGSIRVLGEDKRSCLECRYLCCFLGCPAYGELTPGESSELFCSKKHWRFDAYEDDEKDLRRHLYTIDNCPDFEFRSKQSD